MYSNTVLNTDEVCETLHISKQKLYEMVKLRIIRPLQIQKRPFLFPKSEVERVLRDMVGKQYSVIKED